MLALPGSADVNIAMPSESKLIKVFEVERERVGLFTQQGRALDALEVKLHQAWDAVVKSKDMAEAADGTVPGLKSYAEIMAKKCPFFHVIAVSAKYSFSFYGLIEPEGATVGDDEFKQVLAFETLLTLEKSRDPKCIQGEELVQLGSKTKELTDKKRRLSLMLRLFSFDPVEGKFGINVQVEEVSSLLSKLKLALKCEWMLMQLLEAAVARREPLPVARCIH